MHADNPPYALRKLLVYFLKLGASGFGGPVALVGYMHRDLVEARGWIPEDEFRNGLTLAQLAPGPLAAQLGIYMGFVHYGIPGATLCGFAFILPSFLMVVALGFAYTLFGGMPVIQAVFYGVGAAVIGIIVRASYALTMKTVGRSEAAAGRNRWLPWCLYACALVVTVVTRTESIPLFIAAGFIVMIAQAPPKRFWKSPALRAFVAPVMLARSPDWATLVRIAGFFAKSGAFVFGSGLAIVPFLHGGVVNEYHWLNERQFVDAVAVAMITPGPVVITVGFIGYLVAGVPGACVAAAATFLPCWVLTILPAPHVRRIASNRRIRAFIDGVTAAVVGALAGAVILIARQCVTDVPTAAMAVGSVLVLTFRKRVHEPVVIIVAAVAGVVLKLVL